MTSLSRLTVALAFLCTCASFAPPAAAEGGAAAARLTLTIVAARGSGEREGQAEAVVAKELADYRTRLAALHTRHARFEHDGTMERTAALGERINVPFAHGGALALTSGAAEDPARIRLRIEETLPGAKEPCIKTVIDATPGVPAAVFCDLKDTAGTHVFFVTARFAAP